MASSSSGRSDHAWNGLPRHLLKTRRQSGVPEYFDARSRRWVVVPKTEHKAFDAHIRQLANQLPIHEKLIDPDAGLGWRLLFLVTIPITGPIVVFYAYLRGLFTGNEF